MIEGTFRSCGLFIVCLVQNRPGNFFFLFIFHQNGQYACSRVQRIKHADKPLLFYDDVVCKPMSPNLKV